METWRKFIHRHKSVSWLVVAAVVLLTLAPLHMHLHHDDHAESSYLPGATADKHSHASTIHTASDTTGHEEVTVVSVKSDSIVKKSSLNPVLLAAFISIVFFLALALSSHTLRPLIVAELRHWHISLSPPLRAPPA